MIFKLTDETIDSYGEIILADGVDTDRFLNNPIMFEQHHSYGWLGASAIIGKWKNLTKIDNALFAEPVFANTKKAKEIESLVKDGFLQAVSVGIIVKEWKPGKGKQPDVISKCELLEVSFVNIPANPNAVVQKSKDEAEQKVVDVPKTAQEAFETQKTYYKSFQFNNSMEEYIENTTNTTVENKNLFKQFTDFLNWNKKEDVEQEKTFENRLKALEDKKTETSVSIVSDASNDSDAIQKALQKEFDLEKSAHQVTKTALETITADRDKQKALAEKYGAKSSENISNSAQKGDDDFSDKDEQVEYDHNTWVEKELKNY